MNHESEANTYKVSKINRVFMENTQETQMLHCKICVKHFTYHTYLLKICFVSAVGVGNINRFERSAENATKIFLMLFSARSTRLLFRPTIKKRN